MPKRASLADWLRDKTEQIFVQIYMNTSIVRQTISILWMENDICVASFDSSLM